MFFFSFTENMRNICPAYLFSYDWFTNIIETTINSNIELKNMVQVFIASLYKAVSRTVFEKVTTIELKRNIYTNI